MFFWRGRTQRCRRDVARNRLCLRLCLDRDSAESFVSAFFRTRAGDTVLTQRFRAVPYHRLHNVCVAKSIGTSGAGVRASLRRERVPAWPTRTTFDSSNAYTHALPLCPSSVAGSTPRSWSTAFRPSSGGTPCWQFFSSDDGRATRYRPERCAAVVTDRRSRARRPVGRKLRRGVMDGAMRRVGETMISEACGGCRTRRRSLV